MSRALVRMLARLGPEPRRLWAARILVSSFPAEVVCHVAVQLSGEGSAFTHLTTWVSWLAIQLTAADVVLTSDVKTDVAT